MQTTISRDRVTGIARLCHEANRVFCVHLGDTSQLTWDEAPEWQRQSAISGVEFHVANPDAGPSASHDEWMRHKVAEGWVYGEIKDADEKTHPCIVTFDQLDPGQQFKDILFRTVVHGAWLIG